MRTTIKSLNEKRKLTSIPEILEHLNSQHILILELLRALEWSIEELEQDAKYNESSFTTEELLEKLIPAKVLIKKARGKI